jgi:hypothetical protein
MQQCSMRHFHWLPMYRNNALQTISETISDLPWSHRLSQILRPIPSNSLFNQPTFIIRPPPYPSGEIWKHIFSVCVYSDLAGSRSRILWGKSNRRFVRFEQIGLSGVILYEIPAICESMGCIRPMFTVEDVFGGDCVDGMSITRLLELTNAKMIYFPAYACTSFTVSLLYSFLTVKALNWLVFIDGTGHARFFDKRPEC